MFRLRAQQRVRIPLIIAGRLWRFYLQIFAVLHAEAAPVPLGFADKAVEAQPGFAPSPEDELLTGGAPSSIAGPPQEEHQAPHTARTITGGAPCPELWSPAAPPF